MESGENTGGEVASEPIEQGQMGAAQEATQSRGEQQAKEEKSAKQSAKPAVKDEEKPKTYRKRKVKLADDVEFDLDDLDEDVIDLRKHKVRRKIDGKEVDVEIGRMPSDYEIRQASYDRFREADRLRKAVEGIKGRVRRSDGSIDSEQLDGYLREVLGVEDPLMALEDQLARKVQLEQLQEENPAEAAKALAQMEIDRYKREEARKQKAAQEAERRQREEQAHRQWLSDLKQARVDYGLEDVLGLGALQIMWDRFNKMGRPADPRQLAQETQDLLREELETRIRGLDDDALEALLGPELLKRLQKRSVARVKGNGGSPPEPASKPAPKTGKRVYRNSREMMDALYPPKKGK